jgi:two-component system chemotaxis response regulator CheB
MPANAIAHVAVDAVVPSELIAPTVATMVSGGDVPPGAAPAGPLAPDPAPGEPVTTICPECGGVLTEHLEGGMTQWECRVGHRFSPDSLADAQAAGVEGALWAAVRALEDRKVLLARMAGQAEARGQPRSADSFRQRAEAAGEHAQQVRAALARAAATTLRTIEHGDPDHAPEEESAA